jgi:hypothetical protein
MKPVYALHKDASGAVLAAGNFDYSFKLGDWLKSLDIRAGDRIEFGEVLEREKDRAPLVDVAA